MLIVKLKIFAHAAFFKQATKGVAEIVILTQSVAQRPAGKNKHLTMTCGFQ